MGERSFHISIIGTAVLTVSQLWPDGDAPENPTVEDVEALIEECGGLANVLGDWSIEDDFEIDVAKGVV